MAKNLQWLAIRLAFITMEVLCPARPTKSSTASSSFTVWFAKPAVCPVVRAVCFAVPCFWLFSCALPMTHCAPVTVNCLREDQEVLRNIPARSLSILLLLFCTTALSVWFPLSFTTPVITHLCVLQATYSVIILFFVFFYSKSLFMFTMLLAIFKGKHPVL